MDEMHDQTHSSSPRSQIAKSLKSQMEAEVAHRPETDEMHDQTYSSEGSSPLARKQNVAKAFKSQVEAEVARPQGDMPHDQTHDQTPHQEIPNRQSAYSRPGNRTPDEMHDQTHSSGVSASQVPRQAKPMERTAGTRPSIDEMHDQTHSQTPGQNVAKAFKSQVEAEVARPQGDMPHDQTHSSDSSGTSSHGQTASGIRELSC